MPELSSAFLRRHRAFYFPRLYLIVYIKQFIELNKNKGVNPCQQTNSPAHRLGVPAQTTKPVSDKPINFQIKRRKSNEKL